MSKFINWYQENLSDVSPILGKRVSQSNRKSLYYTLVTSRLLEEIQFLTELNRQVDQERVGKLVEHELNYFKIHKEYDYPGTITLGVLKGKNTFYLIDGQHRVESLRQLLIISPLSHITIYLEIYLLSSMEEFRERLIAINSAVPVPVAYLQLDKSAEIIANDLHAKYSKSFTSASNPQQPHLNLAQFKSALIRLFNRMRDQDNVDIDAAAFSQILINYHKSLKKMKKKELLEGLVKEDAERVEKAAKKARENGKLFIGIYDLRTGVPPDYQKLMDKLRYLYLKNLANGNALTPSLAPIDLLTGD